TPHLAVLQCECDVILRFKSVQHIAQMFLLKAQLIVNSIGNVGDFFFTNQALLKGCAAEPDHLSFADNDTGTAAAGSDLHAAVNDIHREIGGVVAHNPETRSEYFDDYAVTANDKRFAGIRCDFEKRFTREIGHA